MSEQTPEDLYEPDGEDKVVPMRRSAIDRLEASAKKARDLETRAVEAERKLAFAEAGLNIADPKLKYFVKGYDGDLTAEAITSAAQEAGFVAKPDTGTAEQRESADAAARVSAAAAGASAPSNNQVKDADYQAAFAEAMKSGDWSKFDQVAAQYGPVLGVNVQA